MLLGGDSLRIGKDKARSGALHMLTSKKRREAGGGRREAGGGKQSHAMRCGAMPRCHAMQCHACATSHQQESPVCTQLSSNPKPQALTESPGLRRPPTYQLPLISKPRAWQHFDSPIPQPRYSHEREFCFTNRGLFTSVVDESKEAKLILLTY